MADFKMSMDTLAPLAKHGWRDQFIPLHRWDYADARGRMRGKSPRDPGWRTIQYSIEELDEHIRSGGNIGIRLAPGQLIVDYDPRNDESGTSIEALELQYGIDFERCPKVITGSGGAHYYFACPPDLKLKNSLPEYPGVEYKSVGRQVVAPGSKHPSGTLYEWAGPDRTVSGPLPDLPPELIADIMIPQSRNDRPQQLSISRVIAALDQIDVMEFRGDHDAWLQLMMSVHAASGGSHEGREAFVAWCIGDDQYANDDNEIRHRWDTLDEGGGVTAGTLFHYLREAGGEIPPPPAEAFEAFPNEERAALDGALEAGQDDPPFAVNQHGNPTVTLQNAVVAINALGVAPAFNEFTDTYELHGDLERLREADPGIEPSFNDRARDAIRMWIMDHWNLALPLTTVTEAVKGLALRARYNPVVDYLESLTWDGQQRVSGFLSKYCGAEPRAYTSEASRIMLTSAVARAYEPGVKVDTMVILESRKQGLGKSTALELLASPDWFTDNLPGGNPGKDHVVTIQGRWIVEVAELEAMKRVEVEHMKAFVSRRVDRVRMPYAENACDYPRRCIMVGTTNEDTYLSDTTGNRRYLPVKVGKVDLAALSRDRDQIWAEAVMLWKANPHHSQLFVREALRAEAAVQAEARRNIDPWEFQLSRADDWKAGERYHVSEILQQLGVNTPRQTVEHQRRVGRALRVAGWEPVQKKTASGRRQRAWAPPAAWTLLEDDDD